jgi:hypothetical protein
MLQKTARELLDFSFFLILYYERFSKHKSADPATEGPYTISDKSYIIHTFIVVYGE